MDSRRILTAAILAALLVLSGLSGARAATDLPNSPPMLIGGPLYLDVRLTCDWNWKVIGSLRIDDLYLGLKESTDTSARYRGSVPDGKWDFAGTYYRWDYDGGPIYTWPVRPVPEGEGDELHAYWQSWAELRWNRAANSASFVISLNLLVGDDPHWLGEWEMPAEVHVEPDGLSIGFTANAVDRYVAPARSQFTPSSPYTLESCGIKISMPKQKPGPTYGIDAVWNPAKGWWELPLYGSSSFVPLQSAVAPGDEIKVELTRPFTNREEGRSVDWTITSGEVSADASGPDEGYEAGSAYPVGGIYEWRDGGSFRIEDLPQLPDKTTKRNLVGFGVNCRMIFHDPAYRQSEGNSETWVVQDGPRGIGALRQEYADHPWVYGPRRTPPWVPDVCDFIKWDEHPLEKDVLQVGESADYDYAAVLNSSQLEDYRAMNDDVLTTLGLYGLPYQLNSYYRSPTSQWKAYVNKATGDLSKSDDAIGQGPHMYGKGLDYQVFGNKEIFEYCEMADVVQQAVCGRGKVHFEGVTNHVHVQKETKKNPPATCTLQGQVTMFGAVPVAGADVTLSLTSGRSTPYSAKTDALGNYVIEHVVGLPIKGFLPYETGYTVTATTLYEGSLVGASEYKVLPLARRDPCGAPYVCTVRTIDIKSSQLPTSVSPRVATVSRIAKDALALRGFAPLWRVSAERIDSQTMSVTVYNDEPAGSNFSIYDFAVSVDPGAEMPRTASSAGSPSSDWVSDSAEAGVIRWVAPDFSGAGSIPPGSSLGGFIVHVDQPIDRPLPVTYSVVFWDDENAEEAGAAYINDFAPLPYPYPETTVEQIRLQGSGQVLLPDVVVTRDCGDRFNVEVPGEVGGMAVVGIPPMPGTRISLIGTVGKTEDDEIVLTNPTISVRGKQALAGGLGMGTLSLGGATSKGMQIGIPGSVGPNNVGMDVVIWGRVTGAAPDCTWITVDDGAGRDSGEASPGVKVTGLMEGSSAVGLYIVVPASISMKKVGDTYYPLLRTSYRDDVRYYGGEEETGEGE